MLCSGAREGNEGGVHGVNGLKIFTSWAHGIIERTCVKAPVKWIR